MLLRYLAEQYKDDEVVNRSMGQIRATLFDIRKFLLENSELGRQLLSLYREQANSLQPAVDRDPELKKRVLAMFMKAMNFAQDMIRVHTFGSDVEYAGMYVFTSKDLNEGRELLRDLRRLSASGTPSLLLDYVEQMMTGFADKNSREVLALLDPRSVPDSRLG